MNSTVSNIDQLRAHRATLQQQSTKLEAQLQLDVLNVAASFIPAPAEEPAAPEPTPPEPTPPPQPATESKTTQTIEKIENVANTVATIASTVASVTAAIKAISASAQAQAEATNA